MRPMLGEVVMRTSSSFTLSSRGADPRSSTGDRPGSSSTGDRPRTTEPPAGSSSELPLHNAATASPNVVSSNRHPCSAQV